MEDLIGYLDEIQSLTCSANLLSSSLAPALGAPKRYTPTMARPKDPQETRQRLQAAADEVFYAQGLRNSSVDDVAKSAGLTKLKLYYHFPSMDAFAQLRYFYVIVWSGSRPSS